MSCMLMEDIPGLGLLVLVCCAALVDFFSDFSRVEVTGNTSPGAAPLILEGMVYLLVSRAVDILGEVASEAAVFEFVSELFKRSDSEVAVIRVEGIEALCLSWELLEAVVNFFVIFGNVVVSAPELEVDSALLVAMLAKEQL